MSKFMDRTATVHQSGRDSRHISLRGISAVRQILIFPGSKGGVGKTTVMVNMAKALCRNNHRVGIIDTTGSAELLLASSPLTESSSQKPPQRAGISIISLYHLTAPQLKPVLTTEEIKSKLLEVFDQSAWGNTDFLFIDLPSNHMELALYLAEILPGSKFLLVTTPAPVALAELRQDIRQLASHQISPLGLIENMSFFMCDHQTDPIELTGIFSAGGGQRVSAETMIPLLATLPISKELCAAAEAGQTVIEHSPHSDAALFYNDLAKQLVATLQSLAQLNNESC